MIHDGDGNDETDIEFLPDGRLLATTRLEVTPDTILGHYDGRTGIAVAATRMGGILSRKRTSIYRVEPERLVRLTDLPSSGDTSYAGVAIRDDHLWIDYYTSPIDRDWPWLFGMPLQTNIHMAKIPLDALRALSAATP